MNLSGNGPLSLQGTTGRLIAADLKVSGNGGLLVNTNGSASGGTQTLVVVDGSSWPVGSNSLVSTIGDLAAGMHTVAVVGLAADADAEEARIEDALASLDAALAPYGVSLVEVFGDTTATAEIRLQIAATSTIGGLAEGVLGVTVGKQITIIANWNWYTAPDPGTIGGDQYDFQTVVTHELGHSIGLGHSGDSRSVMYPYLQPATTRRDLSAGDLTTLEHDAATEPEPLRASPPAEMVGPLPAAARNRRRCAARRAGTSLCPRAVAEHRGRGPWRPLRSRTARPRRLACARGGDRRDECSAAGNGDDPPGIAAAERIRPS